MLSTIQGYPLTRLVGDYRWSQWRESLIVLSIATKKVQLPVLSTTVDSYNSYNHGTDAGSRCCFHLPFPPSPISQRLNHYLPQVMHMLEGCILSRSVPYPKHISTVSPTPPTASILPSLLAPSLSAAPSRSRTPPQRSPFGNIRSTRPPLHWAHSITLRLGVAHREIALVMLPTRACFQRRVISTTRSMPLAQSSRAVPVS